MLLPHFRLILLLWQQRLDRPAPHSHRPSDENKNVGMLLFSRVDIPTFCFFPSWTSWRKPQREDRRKKSSFDLQRGRPGKSLYQVKLCSASDKVQNAPPYCCQCTEYRLVNFELRRFPPGPSGSLILKHSRPMLDDYKHVWIFYKPYHQ
jgi:hypothetical protein